MRATARAFLLAPFLGSLTFTLVVAFAAPASGRGAALTTPTPTDRIPLQSIDGLTSFTATVNLEANGLIGGKRAVGGLRADLTSTPAGSKATISGDLLGPIAAQVGGSVIGLFTPRSVDVYKVPQGTYVVANGLVPVCIKPEAAQATSSLDDMSPQALLAMLTNSDVARGRLVGQETLNGRGVRHYRIDGEQFLAAAQASSDPKLRSFGEALWSAQDADLYVDQAGGYPVAFRGEYSGSYAPLQFEGDFGVDIELTGINPNAAVTLPSSCNRPISG